MAAPDLARPDKIFAAVHPGGIMRNNFVFACITGVASLALAQNPVLPSKPDDSGQASSAPVDSQLKNMFEAKIKAEWEALKNKDKKSYAELLADDYQGVEVDGRGERNKIQAVNELVQQNVFNYTLWGHKVIPLSTDAALVIYESTIQFPPGAQIRISRVYISEIWVKRAGQWKELHYQETRVK
ncbi:MAG: nuclear transport factor 2 family protein [Terriglobales bacterium]